MKSIFTIMLLTTLSAMASESPLMEINPNSIESIEKNFPKAIETETILDQGERTYIKGIGPKTKVHKRVKYDVLIPKLIEALQEQHKEIEKLKARAKIT